MTRCLLIALCLLAACAPAPTRTPPLPTVAVLPSPSPTLPTATPMPPTPTPPYTGLGVFQGEIASGAVRSGTLTGGEPAHIYTYTGRAGEIISAVARRRSGRFDPALWLYGPDGRALAADDDTGANQAALIGAARLPADGLYSLQVTGGVGGYTVSLSRGQTLPPTPFPAPTATPPGAAPSPTPAPDDGRLYDHAPARGALNRAGDVARYTFFATGGTLFSLSARPAAGAELRLRLEVYDPVGALLAEANPDAAGAAALIAQRAAETGPYQVIVMGQDATSGGFEVAYGRGLTSRAVWQGEITRNGPISGALAAGERHLWSVYLPASAELRLSTDDTGLELTLIAPSGAAAAASAEQPDGAGLLLDARAPVAGFYQAQVAAVSGGAAAYTLTARIASADQPPPAARRLLTFDDTLPDNTPGDYPFWGQAGTTVRVCSAGLPGLGFTPTAALYAPDERVLEAGSGCLTAALPADGVYHVSLGPHPRGGRFRLTVDAI